MMMIFALSNSLKLLHLTSICPLCCSKADATCQVLALLVTRMWHRYVIWLEDSFPTNAILN